MAIAPNQALFIGDGSSDEHRGAAACGIDSLLVTYFLDGIDQQALKKQAQGSKGHISESLKLIAP